MVKNFYLRFWRSRFNIPRRAFWKIIRILVAKLNLYAVSSDFQNSQMMEIGLVREDGLTKLNKVLKNIMLNSYDENNGMFSEHLILLSSISIASSQIRSVLEIGTYDGKTSVIVNKIFPEASITTIDLPIKDKDFESTYNRSGSANTFADKRNTLLNSSNQIKFLEINSIALSEMDNKFDVIWIDGAHGYPVVAMDIINTFRLCNKGGYVLVDDVWKNERISDKYYHSVGAMQSLSELKSANLIDEYFLIPKRISSYFNLPWNKKFIGFFRKT